MDQQAGNPWTSTNAMMKYPPSFNADGYVLRTVNDPSIAVIDPSIAVNDPSIAVNDPSIAAQT